MSTSLTLPADTNQALGLAQYALDFLAASWDEPGENAWLAVERFHRDSVACGVSAIARGANAPCVLRAEALEYPVSAGQSGGYCFGSTLAVQPEKAVVANSSAVREWDSNGTNFGYNPARGATRGEFGHNDFYPVVMAAAVQRGLDGRQTLRGMLLLDEIRGRLAEVFALREHSIDHVVHGAIASAAVYGAMLGATAAQIESAIGMTVGHYIPFRALRAGKQLSDSKGASAALSAEAAVLSVRRAMRGFVGPADVFRNPLALFNLFEKPDRKNASPFDLTLSCSGDGFAIEDMHFKLGLYEHQSAGAIAGLLDIIEGRPELLASADKIRRIRIALYEPAFGIIGDPHKRDPQNRQSADHSMVYIVATVLRKALETKQAGWKALMLLPGDYDDAALFHPITRALMSRIELVHGGPEYDRRYPDGIPTSLAIDHTDLGSVDSGLVMYPLGHARNTNPVLAEVLRHKFLKLAADAVDDPAGLESSLTDIRRQNAGEVKRLYQFPLKNR